MTPPVFTKKPVVLIFEPDDRAAEAVKTLLMGESISAKRVASEDELRQWLTWGKIKGIILGDRLPSTNPKLLVDWINEDSSTAKLPVMLLSKSTFAGSIQIKMPTPYWTPKPIDPMAFKKSLIPFLNSAPQFENS